LDCKEVNSAINHRWYLIHYFDATKMRRQHEQEQVRHRREKCAQEDSGLLLGGVVCPRGSRAETGVSDAAALGNAAHRKAATKWPLAMSFAARRKDQKRLSCTEGRVVHFFQKAEDATRAQKQEYNIS
jgi:hypothetical protein